MNAIDEAVQTFLDSLQKTFSDYHNKPLASPAAAATSPPSYDTSSSDDSSVSSPCYASDDSSWSGGPYNPKQVASQDENIIIPRPVQRDPRILSRDWDFGKNSAVATTPSGPRVVQGYPIIRMQQTNTKTGNPGSDVSFTEDNSTPIHDHVGNNPITANKAKEFKVPIIAFNGTVYFNKLKSLPVSPAEMFNEGRLVDEFIEDFEKEVMRANLNLEYLWYDLLEACFKEARATRMNLYVWFKKRLHEGLSWDNAQLIIRAEFGFTHPDSIKELGKIASSENNLSNNLPFPNNRPCYIPSVPTTNNFQEEASYGLYQVSSPMEFGDHTKKNANANYFTSPLENNTQEKNAQVQIPRNKKQKERFVKTLNTLVTAATARIKNKKVSKKLNIVQNSPKVVKPIVQNQHIFF